MFIFPTALTNVFSQKMDEHSLVLWAHVPLFTLISTDIDIEAIEAWKGGAILLLIKSHF